MADGKELMDKEALNGIGVAPPNPGGEKGANAAGESASESAEGAQADARTNLTGEEKHYAADPGQRAMQDEGIRDRIQANPDDPDAKVDVGSDESMDASDPVAAAQPGSQEPVPSSGYPEGNA